MAKPKYDGVIETVHYKPDGQVDWVRAYLRLGPIFTDRVKLDRQTLVDHLKSGKLYRVGRRVPLMGGTFETGELLKLIQQNGREVLITGDLRAEQDRLEGVPII